MDGTKTRTSGGNTLPSRRTAPLKPKSGLSGPPANETLCISCDLCALACPENLIVVTSERNEKTRRKELTNFTYDLSRCMFCGLCEDACPTDALELTQDFELANYTREGAIWNREMLEKGPQPTQYKK